MTEQQQPAAPTPATTAVADPPPPPPPAGYDASPQPPRKRFRDRFRAIPRAAWLSAAAVVVVVGVALGGFFIGRATAPDGGDGRFPFERGERPDFPGGNGQLPGGPGQGQMPGMPGQQGQQGQPGTGAEDGTEDGTGTTEGSADATASYVVPSAA
jgi:hypothetical protein